MGIKSGVAWTDASWSPWIGCQPVSSGCDHCYAAREMTRYKMDPHTVRRTSRKTFEGPLRWNGIKRVFVCPWSDFFHPAADLWRAEAWDVIRARYDLTFIILTKRIEAAADRLPDGWGTGWPHVILGVTAENQAAADRRIPILLELPARRRAVSIEPMLGPVDLRPWLNGHRCPDPQCGDYCRIGRRLDWVIVGCESGPEPRLMRDDWARDVRDQCAAARTPKRRVSFFLKQLLDRQGRLRVTPELDGQTWTEFPEDL